MIIPPRVAERAASRFVIDGECHVSTYSTGSHGYAQIGWVPDSATRSTMTTAHRAAWVYANGPIPEGMTVDHTCRNRRCVRVDHLRLLTLAENSSDGRHARRWVYNRHAGTLQPIKEKV